MLSFFPHGMVQGCFFSSSLIEGVTFLYPFNAASLNLCC